MIGTSNERSPLPFPIDRWSLLFLALLSFGGTLVLYRFTAAPDLLSGDSAEFQFAAAILGVPHPTGYPLFTLLGKLATFLQMGSVAHRVTLISVIAGAGTVALTAILTHLTTGSLLAGVLTAVALATATSLWNAATIAEVYTLNTLFIALLACLLFLSQSPSHRGLTRCAAACVTGLGISHHGSFAFSAAPLLLFFGVLPLFQEQNSRRRGSYGSYGSHGSFDRQPRFLFLRMVIWGIIGLLPWTYVLIQYARFGPFNGFDHGLYPYVSGEPITYFWGAPQTWREAVDHLFGGVMRQRVFIAPTVDHLFQTAIEIRERLWADLSPAGLVLSIIGCLVLFFRRPAMWVGSMWMAGITVFYYISLGEAVTDEEMFLSPLLLPCALWIGVGAAAIARGLAGNPRRSMGFRDRSKPRMLHPIILLFLVLMGITGYQSFPDNDKSDRWIYRTFGHEILARVEPSSVIITRWEQGTILYYLQYVEEYRRDVWVDIVEPGDEDWLQRARRRYQHLPVYIIGTPAESAALGAEYVWGTNYATLSKLSLEDIPDAYLDD